MPKVAVRPLRSSSYRFPHASPVSTSGAGKQEAAPEDRFKPLISLSERPETWVTVCTGHMGDTSRQACLAGGVDAVEGVFGYG